MMGSISLGVPGVSVARRTHLCAFYRGAAERDEILIPYLREGMKAGERCVCVGDAADPDAIQAALGPEVATDASGRQLDLLAAEDVYFPEGRFCPQEMLDFLNHSGMAALADPGCPFTRLVGEMTWALRELPGVEELVGYESEVNRLAPRYPWVLLCLYDLERFSGELLVDILKTHPRVLMFGAVLDNPYYQEPDEFLART
ncbi:MAG: MEDS domain-containing protein [Actinomycetota bacterium]